MSSVVVIIEGHDGPPRRLTFDRSPVRIGRGPDNDLQLPMAFVSERHAQIRFQGERVEYLDLGSTNGSFLDGQKIPAHTPLMLKPGLQLSIGTVVLSLDGHVAPELAAVPPGDQSARPPASPTIPAVDWPPATPPSVLMERPPGRKDGKKDGKKDGSSKPSYNLPTIIPPELLEAKANIGPPSLAPEPAPPQPAVDRERTAPPGKVAGEIRLPNTPARPAVAEAAELQSMRELATLLGDEVLRLRAAAEAFGRETGVRIFNLSERSRLHELRDGADLVRFLNVPGQGAARHNEVRSLFADLVAHELAMMGAIVEGARATLGRVDPDRFLEGKQRRLLPFLDSGRWEEYVAHFRDVHSDDQTIQEAVFGPEFAEAYAAARGK